MEDTSDFPADWELPRARLGLLLKHFSRLDDDREPWRVMYPLSEVLLLLTCATIASCDDFDDIAAWGRHHLDFLRRFAPFHFGIPGERWLRTLVIADLAPPGGAEVAATSCIIHNLSTTRIGQGLSFAGAGLTALRHPALIFKPASTLSTGAKHGGDFAGRRPAGYRGRDEWHHHCHHGRAPRSLRSAIRTKAPDKSRSCRAHWPARK